MDPTLKSKTVLLVDGNSDMRRIVRSILSNLGVGRILTAAKGTEAWRQYSNESPDIILLDWDVKNMPSMELTSKIRRDPESTNKEIPIIIMTGATSKKKIILARDAGVTEFIIKPVSLKRLKKYLIHAIENPRDFIISKNYIGPDRRRKEIDLKVEKLKRASDKE